MTQLIIKDAVIREAPEHTGYKYYVMHPQNDAILAYVNSAEDANRITLGLENLALALEDEKKYEVVMLMKEDIRIAGFNADSVSDEDMEDLAQACSDALGNDVFSDAVSDWCMKRKLPELEN